MELLDVIYLIPFLVFVVKVVNTRAVPKPVLLPELQRA